MPVTPDQYLDFARQMSSDGAALYATLTSSNDDQIPVGCAHVVPADAVAEFEAILLGPDDEHREQLPDAPTTIDLAALDSDIVVHRAHDGTVYIAGTRRAGVLAGVAQLHAKINEERDEHDTDQRRRVIER